MEVNYTNDEKVMIRLEDADQGQTVLVYGKGTAKMVTGMFLTDHGMTRRMLVLLGTGETEFWDANTMVQPVEAVMTIKE